jgi:histidine decarboxylase
MQKNITHILQNAVSPFELYCSSCGMQPMDSYVTTPLITSSVTPIECSHSGSDLLDKIIAFDKAEGEFANITQTNMVTVSSFNGLNGVILGYDLLRQPLQRHGLIDERQYPRVYDAQPLFAVTQALYGTVREKHFPIAPGQHLLCAYKTFYHTGPSVIYGALALAIAEDRTQNADLYMEDHGTLAVGHNNQVGPDQQSAVIENLILSVERVSQNLGVRYEKIFIGSHYRSVKVGEVGCVITAAPYVHIARRAIPHNDPALLQRMTLNEWNEYAESHFLAHKSSNHSSNMPI